MTRRVALLVLATLQLSGCFTVRRYAPTPVLAWLVSPTGFRVVQPPDAARAESSCTVLRAKMEVAAVRNDTLYFDRVTVLRQPVGAAPCAHPGAGYVALAAHPDLRSERLAVNGVLTWVAIAAAVPTVMLWLLVAVGPGT